jgi:putative photosynthetic complex assembly protein
MGSRHPFQTIERHHRTNTPTCAALCRSTRGSINVIDQSTEQLVQNFQGEQGFLRGTLRALVRERKLRGVDTTTERAFELIAHSGGRLTLRDPATGASIALESFGPSNTAVFARLIH